MYVHIHIIPHPCPLSTFISYPTPTPTGNDILRKSVSTVQRFYRRMRLKWKKRERKVVCTTTVASVFDHGVCVHVTICTYVCTVSSMAMYSVTHSVCTMSSMMYVRTVSSMVMYVRMYIVNHGVCVQCTYVQVCTYVCSHHSPINFHTPLTICRRPRRM